MNRNHALVLAVFFAIANPARADKMDVQIMMSRANFNELRTHMIEQMDSDSYAEITATDKAAVIGALDRIELKLAKSPVGDQDRVDIFNDQALVNQITARAKIESRIYCEREFPTGSHVMRVTCMSMGRWMERDQDGRNAARAIVDNHRNHASGWISDSAGQNAPPSGH